MSDTINGLTDADLMRPYQYYATDSTREDPVIRWIVGDTFEHYAEHLPWMQAIVDRATD
ncbi:MAG: hypothetical protein H7Y11_04245 [Armatimonadetes bacterium]|nr:hypothetical protein [Anaerolineae bacterium]